MPHYILYPLDLTKWPQVQLPVAEASIRCIEGTLALLEQPRVWIKEQYELLNDLDSQELPAWQGCLIGALQRIDGKGELLAASILTQVITGELYFDMDLVPNSNQRGQLINNSTADYYFFEGAKDPEKVESFNDHPYTTMDDIRKFLGFAIIEARRVADFARAGLGFPVK